MRSSFARGSQGVSIASTKPSALLDQALAAGHPGREIEQERAALLQATGRYREALVLRKRLAKDDPGIHTLGALASLLAEMDQSAAADNRYAAALDADMSVSPLPCSQLLFEWGVSAMRRGEVARAEEILAELDRDPARACPGTGASRRGGARARAVGCRPGAHRAVGRRLGRSRVPRHLCGDPGRAWRAGGGGVRSRTGGSSL